MKKRLNFLRHRNKTIILTKCIFAMVTLLFSIYAVVGLSGCAFFESDYTFVANIVNEYKNMIGKPMVVVIQSQLGDPICSYSGNDIYWEVSDYSHI